MLPPRFSDRLITDFEWARRQQDPFLRKRLDIWRQIVGKHYGAQGCKQRIPVNSLAQFVYIYSRYLSSRSPACLVEAADPRLRPLAKGAQFWANQRFQECNLEKILQLWAIDALTYNVGIIKVCDEKDPYGDYESPYVDTVDPERFIWDMRATNWKACAYAGHRFDFQKERMFDQEGVDNDRVRKLTPSPRPSHNEIGGDRSESLTTDSQLYEGLYEIYEAWEFYLPQEQILATYPVVGNTVDRRPIRVKPYTGPKESPLGPFHGLVFNEVSGNLMGSPPIHQIYDLHEARNKIVRKLLLQAENQKTNMLVQETNRSDGETLKKAKDQQILSVGNPKGFEVIRSNGPDQQNMAFAMALNQDIDRYAGNMSMLAGLGVQAPTATQETMLEANASKMLTFYQAEMRSATQKVMRSIVWYDWHSKRDMQYQVPFAGNVAPPKTFRMTAGLDTQDPTSVWRNPGSYDKLILDVHPYSMKPVSPEMRLAQMTALFMEALQAAPLLMQSGHVLDIPTYLKKKAEYMGFPDWDEIMRFVEQDPLMEAASEPTAPRVRPEGTGQYTRTNVSSQENDDQKILGMMDKGDAA